MLEVLARTLAAFDPLTLVLVAVVTFATSIFHTVSGFAGGLLLAVFLAPVIGVRAIVPVLSVALLISHSSRVWVFRRAVDLGVFRAVMVTGLPACVLGALVYTWLPVDAIAAVLGVFLIATVPLGRVLRARNFRVGARGLSVAGAGFGVLSGGTIGGGMVLIPFLMGAGLSGERLIAQIATVALVVNLTKAVVFGSTALLDANLLAAGVLIGLCTVPGNYVGHWIVRRTPVRIHNLFIEGLILLGGLVFLKKAVEGYGLIG
ncbi:MAG: sulfite exporter TauE/SafE family protein [Proteobacteria bacterium]|nr:sulfite exporter TauE/SafE family protein [Pseudomonadota bacterium]